MANKIYNGENFKHITGDEDENNEDLLDIDEDHLIIAEEETSNKASKIEGDVSPDEDCQGTGGGLAVLMAAIDSFKTANGCISDDPITPEPEEPAADYAGESPFAEPSYPPYNVIATERFSHPSEEISLVSRLIRFYNQNIVYQAYSPPSIPGLHACNCCRRHNRILLNYFGFDMVEVACTLLNSAAAQMEPPVIVDDATVQSIACGLSAAMDFTAKEGTPLIGRQGVGRLVASIIVDRESGVLMAYAVAQLVPQALIDDNTGDIVGMMLHQVTRGFGINENCRIIITENTGPVLLEVNQIPNE
ncbi:uncharacterized protein LOC119560156 [Drosophila subpulchrella]|uniref:uncharacterized protein LOC119560156 n=1 Tax=Drosophila subpulchrella TaxID=1486046 RepID=UPI0018A138F1|nr:uncharacterized protein LOC119560156 [Drosophila subpulchrella]